MTRFEFCSSCFRPTQHLGFTSSSCCAACGRTGLCQACANHVVCQECGTGGTGCCKDCNNLPLPSCSLILCGNERRDAVNGGARMHSSGEEAHQEEQPSSCGHYGCNFQQDCLMCKTEQHAPTATHPGVDQRTATSPTVTGPAENLAMYQASKRPTALAGEQVNTSVGASGETRPVKPKTTEAPIPQASTFPNTLHAMVTDTAAAHPEAISWIEDGEAFKVHDPKSEVLGAVLLKYFSHNKYSSLQRQLNMYGFKKHKKGKYDGAFQHPYFHRDRPDDVENIRRRPPPSASLRARAQRVPKVTSIRRCSTKRVAPQVLSPNRQATTKNQPPTAAGGVVVVKQHYKFRTAAKHLPPKKRFSPAVVYSDAENGTPAAPAYQVKQGTFKGIVAGSRPIVGRNPRA